MTLYFTVKYELYYNLIRGDVSAGILTFLLSQHAITTITVKRCVCKKVQECYISDDTTLSSLIIP